MKRTKIVLNSIAITIAIALALVTRSRLQHKYKPQYIPVNNIYKQAGELGVDYNCYDAADSICTFYQPDSINRPNEFLPSQKGRYMPVFK